MAFKSNCFGDKRSYFISSTILLLLMIGMFVCLVCPYFVFVVFVALVVFIWDKIRTETNSTRCTHQSDGVGGISSTRDETRTSSVTQSNEEQMIELPVKNPVDNPPLYDEVVPHCQFQSKVDGLCDPPTYEEAVQNHVGAHFVNVCFDSSESPDCT